MEDKQITEQESLLLIQQMIQTAKAEQKDDGKGWIMWGWLLFTASILTYLNIELEWAADTYIFWNLFGLVTIVFFVYETIRYFFFKKTQRVKTYTSDLFARLNTGFFLTLMLIIVATNVGITPQKGFSLLIGLYAFWVLVYGTALNFKPSIVASYVMWGIAFVCLFIDDFRWIMLLHALAVLCGYIIPGHLANRAFKRVGSVPYK